jgi:hypothetical protein
MKQDDGYLAVEFLFVFLGWLVPLVFVLVSLVGRFTADSQLQDLAISGANSYVSAADVKSAQMRLKAVIAGSGATARVNCSTKPCLQVGSIVQVTLTRAGRQASHVSVVEVLP